MYILGISAFYHDSAACLVQDGRVIAAAQEERFTRIKHDSEFPRNAIRFCLAEAEIDISQINALVFYEKPFVKFERLLKTYLSFAPAGLPSFFQAIPVWLKGKLFMKSEIAGILHEEFGGQPENTYFYSHHRSHAASAFFASPYADAAVLCIDGVGEWSTTTAWQGNSNRLQQLWEIRFPHSLGLLYSAFTYYTGFKVNSGEYKLMGLAPYGKPVYRQKILDNLLDLKADGTFRLNMKYFNYCTGLTMTTAAFHHLFDGPPRQASEPVTPRIMDLARSIQDVTEEIIMRLAVSLQKETGNRNLCLAGGVALNCVANGRLLREGPFASLWIQPAAGDAGGALGAALGVWHEHCNQPRQPEGKDLMQGCYLGPSFSNDEIRQFLDKHGLTASYCEDEQLYETTASDLSAEKVIGWFSGRMEFGPRALGARSIIGDARSEKMQRVMNLKIKFRESFRPFAPSVLRERLSDYFAMQTDTPYMLLTAQVNDQHLRPLSEAEKKLTGMQLLNVPKSDIPAITHVDGSARIQSVHRETNPRYHAMIQAFEKKTGCGVIVNTSFNVRGEPIVCTPLDAYKCFMRTEMDSLVLENYYLRKENQPPGIKDRLGLEEFAPD
ncbi:MAG TPA: carbamoyltransferase [Candidatus Rifleibacterium sp.]|nr:carbamoyltransferase [Candidatus Rifleibacterium sp.]HPT45180.1 carbamoyltransferase [Candidatus Rifleibacterium sp.]